MPNTNDKKITARPYINDSPNYTESLICLNCNLKYLFIIKVRIRDIKIQSKQLWRKKETQILTYTNALKKNLYGLQTTEV